MRTVTIPLEVAGLIDRAFLPVNPNKMRSASPAVVDAVRQFRAAIEAAEREQLATRLEEMLKG